ncbi:MAG: universal stress protein [Mycobacteriales bacterium]
MAFEYGRVGVAALVVGFDGSRSSYDALAYGAGMARRSDALLVVAYVSGKGGMADLSSSVAAAAAQTWEEVSREVETEAAAVVEGTGVTWEFVWLHGEVSRALERLACERRLDAIVVGRSSGRLRHVLGSVPNRLVAHAPCPVIVVP